VNEVKRDNEMLHSLSMVEKRFVFCCLLAPMFLTKKYPCQDQLRHGDLSVTSPGRITYIFYCARLLFYAAIL